ncbi:MAG TPA: FkbM family methyltransferase, partial [Vicinamibacterales bacterium]|nr:FkbM family methyltransferase [Vicinamibacterales bacterium]
SEERRPHVRYEAAFVGARDFDALFPSDLRTDDVRSKNNNPFSRVSASRVMKLLHQDYAADAYNRGAPPVMATRRVALDDVLDAASVDFIKVDTDGHDIEVLLGADELIRSNVLGVLVECWFNGASHPYGNTLANIDVFFRSRGFSLFDLDVNRYSRAALPTRFVYEMPAQTVSGQVIWGDALYLRDLGDPSYDQKHLFAITNDRVAKLAALFALFGLGDCVAELLTTRATAMPQPLRGEILDMLPAEVGAPAQTYAEYIAAFDRNPKSWYPSKVG